jgi:hypothetical protein
MSKNILTLRRLENLIIGNVLFRLRHCDDDDDDDDDDEDYNGCDETYVVKQKLYSLQGLRYFLTLRQCMLS